jgi:hypothetical protein
MSNVLQNPPIRDAFVDSQNYIVRSWRNFLLTLQTSTQSAPQIIDETSQSAQTAAITTTTLPLPVVTSGFYRLSVYLLITTKAATSSSAQVTLGWTDDGIPITLSLPALTTNVQGAVTASTITIHVDDNSPVTYAVAYASNLANTMTYNVGVVTEVLP